jgi:hypothetical protein
MEAWQWVLTFHWIIYIDSFIAFALLLTRYRRWGATWIAGLFGIQVLWQGCPVIDWENYYRAQMGLAPITNSLLTDRFGASIVVQNVVAVMVVLAALYIVFLWRPTE